MKEGIVLLALVARLVSPSPSPLVSLEPEPATPAAKIDIQEAAKQDITQSTSPVKDKLGAYLAEKPIGKLSWHNFLQRAIRQAVDKGVSANTIVLVLLFPLVAGLIAAARHLLGLTGFGIFVPAMLSVAFLATGIRVGMLMFVVIWVLGGVSRKLTNFMKLQYLPRMALLMWFVSVGVLTVLLGAVNVELGEVSAVSIFPIMILMLLTENFIEVQTGKSQREALAVMLQTIGMALVGAVLMRLDTVQKFVLLNPEISLLMIGLFDVFVGRYVGLRALEYVKFKKLMK